eukprot:gene37897-49668_t
MTKTRSLYAMAASAGVALALLAGAGAAQARDVNWSVGVGVPGVVIGASNGYYAPAPVYVAPPPPWCITVMATGTIAITATMVTATVATGTVDQPGLCGLVLHQPLGRESLTGSVAQAAFYSGPSGPLFYWGGRCAGRGRRIAPETLSVTAHKTVFVLNGPNLNLLGTREPAVYGAQTLADVEKLCADACQRHGFALRFHQSNHEGALVDWIHEAGRLHAAGELAGVIINAGAYTHTSIALHDAIKGTGITLIELHISNVHAREAYRHHSYMAAAAKAVMCGFGVLGYGLAIDGLAQLLAQQPAA